MKAFYLALLSIVTVVVPARAQAQETEIRAGASVLLSVQPIDDAYVGEPYLNEGIGGLGPGMALTFNVIMPPGFIVAAEFSTAWFELPQEGRLVGGPCPSYVPPNECLSVGGVSTTRLRDPILGGLAGFARRRGDTQAHFLGGISWIMKGPTANGIEYHEQDAAGVHYYRPLAPTGGFEVIHALTPRTSFAAGARYAYVQRDERVRYLGIGSHIFRVGAGLRFRLN